jgi:hypothetical protein
VSPVSGFEGLISSVFFMCYKCYHRHDDDASGYFLVINGVVNTIFCCVVNVQLRLTYMHIV